MTRNFVMLDRDGVIVKSRHYLSEPQQVALLSGAASGLREMSKMGLGLAVVTNQSGIGRGIFDENSLVLVHQRLRELLKTEGVCLDGIYTCPHTPEDNCRCRKPRPGLVEQAVRELDFNPETSFMIGDEASDIELGQRVGATTLLVHAGQITIENNIVPDYVVEDLQEAAQIIRARIHLLGSVKIKEVVAEKCLGSVLAAAHLIITAFQAGKKVLLCGNGGSAADCQHMAAEFVNRLTQEVERTGLPAIALTTDTSFLTAFANDYWFEGVFEHQIYTLGKPGDILIGISTSGESPNVIRAIDAARKKNMQTVVLTGDSGRLAAMADVAISVPSVDVQYIQEAHLTIEHILCDLIERSLFGSQQR